jgi:hypothetical protein
LKIFGEKDCSFERKAGDSVVHPMNEIEFLSIMDQFAFAEIGKISLTGGRPIFELANPGNECGFVYLWVEISGQTFAVVYVGKADGTLQARCKQHTNGFRHDPTGQAHADRFQKGISENKRYVVCARKSETKDVLGGNGVSMAGVEELAFIQKFRPLWNFHSKSLKRR